MQSRTYDLRIYGRKYFRHKFLLMPEKNKVTIRFAACKGV
ncbi:hypothetical protein MnTg02_01398 [bacterium MnTg02]|nr:hypothetical protein MnTg02_01398 [bacterium MnTg02]